MIKGKVTVFTFTMMETFMMVNGATTIFMALESTSLLMVLAITVSMLTMNKSK